ncbi:SSK1 [[Candida] subhashii]|uniref:SSK1 n=1 Tax=[Candida] subhashii TaxID=561895 RepID=A0A8J5QHH1_9ASCO|nr:SSK1 [[Candida] subhashii]KAG7662188.1 SSK1 [[Candida] subhashii]
MSQFAHVGTNRTTISNIPKAITTNTFPNIPNSFSNSHKRKTPNLTEIIIPKGESFTENKVSTPTTSTGVGTSAPPPTSITPGHMSYSATLPDTRRVWVKRLNGTPTTVITHSTDLIDDLKLLIIEKYPNSIGRYFDVADISIRIEISNVMMMASPVSTTPNKKNYTSHHRRQESMQQFVTLEPDQSVWTTLDQYFPMGMNMADALIVETPNSPFENQEIRYSDSQYTTSNEIPPQNQINPQRTSSRHGSLVGGPQIQVQKSQSRNPSLSQPQPIAASPSLVTKSFYNQQLQQQQQQQQNFPQLQQHQPQARHYISTKSSYPGNTLKDRSVSPIFTNLGTSSKKESPGAYHRRSQSSPVSSPNSQFANANPQAVLLLPKNFSLTGGTSLTAKKRHSLDGSSFDNSPTSDSFGDLSGSNEKKSEREHQDKTKDKSGENEDKKQEEGSKTNGGEKINKEKETKVIPTKSPTPSRANSQDKVKTLKKSSKSEGEKRLALQQQTSGPNKMGTSPTDKVLPSISVLVVEDNAINQAILGAFLRKRKIHYEIAKNGQEAIDKWRQGGFHLVLMDIQLPVKSGIEVTKEIRYLEKLNKIGVFDEYENEFKNDKKIELKPQEKLDLSIFRSPVIIVALTASSNSNDRKNALTAGCNDYLTKPVNLVWLQNKITEWGCMQALIDFDGWKNKSSRLLIKNIVNTNKK